MTGVTNRTRTLPERIEVVRSFRDDLLPAIEQGQLVPVVDSIHPLRDTIRFFRLIRHYEKESLGS